MVVVAFFCMTCKSFFKEVYSQATNIVLILIPVRQILETNVKLREKMDCRNW